MNGTGGELLPSASESPCISEGSENIVSHAVMKSSEALSSGMLVVLNGENCILELDAATGHYIAYPAQVVSENSNNFLAPTQNDRQNDSVNCLVPRKKSDRLHQRQKDKDSGVDGIGVKLSEQENNAAEGLLGLADSQETSSSSPPKIDLFSKPSNNAATDARLSDPNVIMHEANQTERISASAVMNGLLPSVSAGKFAADGTKGALKADDNVKDSGGQIVFASSNQIQNFLASLGLPGKT